jgi:hypothetical protein
MEDPNILSPEMFDMVKNIIFYSFMGMIASLIIMTGKE